MAIITPALTMVFGPDCGMGQRRYDLAATSDQTGAQQFRVMGPPRWTLKLVQPTYLTQLEAGEWLALGVRLRGRVNVLAAWDPVRVAPQGSLRGTLTVSLAAVAGATSVRITGGTTGQTIKPGDMLQLGTGLGTSQLVMAAAAATVNAGGQITVPIEPPLRLDMAVNTVVTWDRPLAYYRRQGDITWSYDKRGAVVTGLAMDLLETFA